MYQIYILNPGKLFYPWNASITKHISPAIPNINENGLSLFPVTNLSLKWYVFIYLITFGYYLNKAKRIAFLWYYYALSGKILWIVFDKNTYAFPDIPWHKPNPFLNTPYFQIWSNDLCITSVIPNLIPCYGNSYINLANEFNIPGEPWQKCISLVLVDELDVEKLLLMKCFNKNIILLFITFINKSI